MKLHHPLPAALLLLSATLHAQLLPQGPRNILTYSTYLGGASDDTPRAIALDPQGNVYVVGDTVSPDFPVTPGALQQHHAGVPGTDSNFVTGSPIPDAFVTKFDPTGKIVYSTYLGGSSADRAYAVAADAQGNAYVAGTTLSPNFPVTAGAFQTTANFKTVHSFVAKINPTGSALVYSTLIAASGNDSITAIRLDPAGNVFLTGNTTSTDFPVTPGAFQTTANKGAGPNPNSHGFVAKLNPAGSQLVYATFLTGSTGAFPAAIALTSTGEVLLSGTTLSSDFPTTKGSYLPAYPGSGAVFVSRLNASLSALVFSTFLGAQPIFGGVNAMDIDSTGASYLTGLTAPGFHTTPGAFSSQTSQGVYAMKLNPAGSAVVFSALLGGDNFSLPGSIAVDTQGDVFVTGATHSTNFPLTANAYQTSYSASMCFLPGVGPFATSGDSPNCGDVFFTELDPSGSKLLYSTYFGSNGRDAATAMSLASDGSAYITGATDSAVLPATAIAVQTHRTFGPDCTVEASPSAGGSNPCADAFLARFNPSAPAPVQPWEIVNSASYLPGAIAPGELVALFGPNIGPAQPSEYQLDANGLVTTSLAGIQVMFDGVAAPLLHVGPNQINAVVPYITSIKTKVQVSIVTNGAAGPAQSIEIAAVTPGAVPVAPGLFSSAASGFGQAAAFNQDGTVNGAAHPIPAGSLISLYATGLGATNLTVPDGTITDPSLLPLNMGPVEVFIDGKAARPTYTGNAPYSVAGVSQINVTVPPGTRSGQVPIYVSMGHVVTSQSNIFITVQ